MVSIPARALRLASVPGWAAALGLCMLLAVAFAASFEPSVRVYDEGFALTNAWRLLQGETPYRDYWTAYPPGTAIVLAAAFKLAGASLEVARWVNAGWNCLFVLSTYALVRALCSRAVALTATTALSLLFVAAFYPAYSVTPALTLQLLAVALLAHGLAGHRAPYFLASALAGGVTLAFRHDFAAYFVLALTVAIAALVASGRWRQDTANRSRLVTTWLLTVATGALLLSLIVVVCGLGNFIEQSLVFPATGMRANRALPVPALLGVLKGAKLNWLLAWLVPLGLAALLPALLFSGRTLNSRSMVVLTMLGMLALLLTGQTFSRFDISHAGPSLIVFGAFLTVLLFGTAGQEVGRSVRILASGFSAVFLLVVTLGALPTIDPVRHFKCLREPRSHNCMSIADDARSAAEFVRTRTSASDHVFIGNFRHDRISVNDAFLYFLVQRPIATAWNEMHPGVVTTAAVQRRIIEDLLRHQVRVVVLADMPLFDEPNLSARSSGVTLLDDFFASRFRLTRQVGRYRILELVP